MRRFILFFASSLLAGFVACSDDDGSDVVPNGPPGSGGGGSGGTSDAGPGGSGGSAGRGGTGGGGGGAGGSGGSAGCTPVAVPDAGVDAGDVGSLDAGSSDGGLDASVDGPPSGVVSFEDDIHPLFVSRCGPCHVSFGYGGQNVGSADLDEAYEDAVGLGQYLVTRVDGGGMPPPDAEPPNDCGAEGRGDQPGDPGCLTVGQVELIQTWIDQCYPR